MNRRVISLILVVASVSSLTGCSIIKKSAKDLPLVAQLSEQEVVDYYKEQLTYDSISKRNLEVHEVSYVKQSVSPEVQKKLQNLTADVEGVLASPVYTNNEETKKLLKESVYNYIKAYLNDYKLINGSIVDTGEALGYYFVDVEYDIGPAEIGTFEPAVSLLGLHGAFSQDYEGKDSVNTTLVNKCVNNLNAYYKDNDINKTVQFNQSTDELTMTGNKLSKLDFSQKVAKSDESTEGILMTGQSDRRCPIDTKEFNRMAGASITQSSYMPELSQVYKVPTSSDGISGIGIMPRGIGGLKKFGYIRDDMSGKLTLRYVFKQDVSNPTEITGQNVYPVQSELVSGVSTNTDDVTVPDFLMTEFSKLIERSDRCISDTDLAGLMSGDIFSDCGEAVLTGYESNFVNVMRNMSTIRRVVARDTTNNAYLLEVETLRQEGAKESDTYGTYKDKSYVVVEQLGDQFIITDRITLNREMTKEPAINPDSAVEKRLVSLNLVGEVSDDSKEGIQSLMDDFYKAGTARVLKGPKEATLDGKKVTLERGMYDCFDSEPSMLDSNKKEYMNSKLRTILTKKGTDVSATYNGVITEWIGGADNQAEFTTEEVVAYGNKKKGHYMQVYYLVSRMGDKWVIDDMKILEEEDKEGEELNQILNRICK